MNNDNFDNTAESYLGNIAEELGTISGTCTEIKEAQLNSATVEDVERVGNDVKAAIDSNIKSLDKSISEPWGILNDWRNCMDNNTLSNRETVEEAEERICDRFDDMESHLTEKLDAFTAKPPVREVVLQSSFSSQSDSWLGPPPPPHPPSLPRSRRKLQGSRVSASGRRGARGPRRRGRKPT